MTQRTLIRHTLQSLQSRCLEIGECWIWQGGIDAQGRPQTRHGGKVVYVRRLARELADGKPMPRRLQAAAHCGDHLCVSPHCSYRATPQQRARAAAQRGAYSDAAKIRRSTHTVRARSHITEALVAQVRAATPPCSAIAAATGISLSHVKAIRSGRARRDFSNPFDALLPAR